MKPLGLFLEESIDLFQFVPYPLNATNRWALIVELATNAIRQRIIFFIVILFFNG
jgi:hypothetical protein